MAQVDIGAVPLETQAGIQDIEEQDDRKFIQFPINQHNTYF